MSRERQRSRTLWIMGITPSMEPRTCVQGEDGGRGRHPPPPPRPSMEPRTCVQGEAARALSPCSALVAPSNGAPDLCPGRGPRPPRGMVAALVLQWSPGPMSRERSSGLGWKPLPTSAFNGAPDLCPGRGARFTTLHGARTAFNGAPDLCPGRGTRIGTGHGLQCRPFNGAPDLCPGRASGACRSDRERFPFNGAPDLCPGRGMVP